jgi:hypothetical protein
MPSMSPLPDVGGEAGLTAPSSSSAAANHRDTPQQQQQQQLPSLSRLSHSSVDEERPAGGAGAGSGVAFAPSPALVVVPRGLPPGTVVGAGDAPQQQQQQQAGSQSPTLRNASPRSRSPASPHPSRRGVSLLGPATSDGALPAFVASAGGGGAARGGSVGDLFQKTLPSSGSAGSLAPASEGQAAAAAGPEAAADAQQHHQQQRRQPEPPGPAPPASQLGALSLAAAGAAAGARRPSLDASAGPCAELLVLTGPAAGATFTAGGAATEVGLQWRFIIVDEEQQGAVLWAVFF